MVSQLCGINLTHCLYLSWDLCVPFPHSWSWDLCVPFPRHLEDQETRLPSFVNYVGVFRHAGKCNREWPLGAACGVRAVGRTHVAYNIEGGQTLAPYRRCCDFMAFTLVGTFRHVLASFFDLSVVGGSLNVARIMPPLYNSANS